MHAERGSQTFSYDWHCQKWPTSSFYHLDYSSWKVQWVLRMLIEILLIIFLEDCMNMNWLHKDTQLFCFFCFFWMMPYKYNMISVPKTDMLWLILTLCWFNLIQSMLFCISSPTLFWCKRRLPAVKLQMWHRTKVTTTVLDLTFI